MTGVKEIDSSVVSGNGYMIVQLCNVWALVV